MHIKTVHVKSVQILKKAKDLREGRGVKFLSTSQRGKALVWRDQDRVSGLGNMTANEIQCRQVQGNEH